MKCSIDEREDFNIVLDYYDLKDIEKELIDSCNMRRIRDVVVPPFIERYN